MSLSRFLLVAGCLSALLLDGCGGSSSKNANVRALNLISGASDVKIAAGSTTILTGGTFEALSAFTGVGQGTQEFKVTLASSPGNLVDTVYSLSADISFTFVTSGTPGAAGGLLLADAYGSPTGTNMAFRVLNLAAVEPVVDVYLTAPGADLAAATPTITGASYGAVSAFLNTPAGNLQLRITPNGTKDVLYDAPVALGAGTGQTVVVYSRGSSKLVNIVVLASNTSGAVVNSQLAQLKVANGTGVAAPLNVLVDGTQVVTNLAFAGIAPYQSIAAGTRQVTVESSATPGATLLTLAPNFVPATDSSIALYGAAGSMAGLVLTDSNPAVPSGRASLRVVNVSPDFAAVDVYANFGKLVSGLASPSASTYSLVDAVAAGTPYRFDFNNAGTTNIVLSVPGLALAGGHVYTVYLLGSGPTLSGVLTQDR